MPEFLAERYEPGITAGHVEAAAARLAEAAGEMRAEGLAIEFLGATFVPGDEAALSRFSGASAELVADAHRRAVVPFERVVETRTVGVERDACTWVGG